MAYLPRVATRRGRPVEVRKGKVVKSSSDWVLRASTEWGIVPGVLATQNVDTGLPVAGFSIGQVVTAGTSGVEQVPPGEDAVEGVWAMCLPTIVRVSTRTEPTGAVSTVLVKVLQSR